MRRFVLWTGVGILAGLLLAAAVILNQPYQLRGSAIQSPYSAPDFTLPDGRGQEFHLAGQRGRVVLLFFGFTSCPDVCPTTLSEFKQVRQRLGKDADRVSFVFITVDPDRDTPERMAKYASGFDPSFIGLSGDEAQLGPVWKAYGVYRQLNKASADDTAYEVEHSTQTVPGGCLREPAPDLFLRHPGR